jgi:hypothetical protein
MRQILMLPYWTKSILRKHLGAVFPKFLSAQPFSFRARSHSYKNNKNNMTFLWNTKENDKGNENLSLFIISKILEKIVYSCICHR